MGTCNIMALKNADIAFLTVFKETIIIKLLNFAYVKVGFHTRKRFYFV